jgi:hypothetical protein
MAVSGRPMAHLLVLNGISRGSVETDVRRLIKLISALKGAARRSWRTAERRVFDIGIQAGSDKRPFEEVRLSVPTLRAVSELVVQINVTVYGPVAYDMLGPRDGRKGIIHIRGDRAV